MKIFISYRRKDSEAITGRIYDTLCGHYAPDSLIMDVDKIPLGSDFRKYINHQLAQCTLMIAVVGPKWTGPRRGGEPRIKDEDDWVRLEVEAALRRDIPLIPVLVNKAKGLPPADRLPESLKDIRFRQYIEVESGGNFKSNVSRLIRSMDKTIAESGPATEPEPSADLPTPAPSAADEAAKSKIKNSPAMAPTFGLPAAENAIVVRDRAPPPVDPPPGHEETFDNPRDRHLFGPGPKRVLAIAGGGIRNVIALAYLERIETILSEKAGSPIRLADYFDFVGGTSLSTIFATVLALGYNTATLRELFRDLAPKVFRRARWFSGGPMRVDWGALRDETEEIIGDRSLGSRDLLTGLCIVTQRVDQEAAWVIANNPRAPYWNSASYQRLRLASLLRASMAAPDSFDPVMVEVADGITGLFVDGGLGMHNNPAYTMFLMTALRGYGLCWRTDPKHLTIVSLGAGSHRSRIAPERIGTSGAAKMLINTLKSVLQDAETSVLAQMQMLGVSPTHWRINSEIGNLSGEDEGFPMGGPHFSFLHYDVRLELPWIQQALGTEADKVLGRPLTEADVIRLRSLDNATNIPDLYNLARIAADIQIKPEHFNL